jgi:hypothetical protein
MRLTQVVRFSEKILSAVHRGTAFENRALSLLSEHMSMSLTRVGGSNDGGVDLIGWWWVPGCEKTCACPVLCTPQRTLVVIRCRRPRKAWRVESSKPPKATRPRPMQSRKEEDGAWIPARARRCRLQTCRHRLSRSTAS